MRKKRLFETWVKRTVYGEDQLLLHLLYFLMASKNTFTMTATLRWLAVQNFATALLLLPIGKLVASRSIVR